MNHVHVHIPSDPTYERVVRASAAELAEALGFAAERIDDLKLAVSEAVSNAIDHGNQRNRSLTVEVTFAVTPDHLEVRVIDHGVGVERIDWGRRVVAEEQLDAGMLRGFGMYLMSALVDQCEVQSSSTGTQLTLRLLRP